MNNAVCSVTCPYCSRRQIVELNSQNCAKKVPFYPVSPETAIGGLGGPSGHVSQHAATHVISNAKGTHNSIPQVSNVPSPSSWVSALNIFAFVKVIYRWAK